MDRVPISPTLTVYYSDMGPSGDRFYLTFLSTDEHSKHVATGIHVELQEIRALLLCICGWQDWKKLGKIGGYHDEPAVDYGHRMIVKGNTLAVTTWSGKQTRYSFRKVDMNRLGLFLIAMLLEVD